MAAGPVAERNQDATVYVGGLDDQVLEAILWELFLQAGPVVNVHMPKDRISQSHQGYGFVEFLGEEDADYAIKIMNMIKLYGKPIRVNKASANQKNLDVGANIFIGNLDPEVDEKLLYDVFSAFGVILQTPKIMRDPDTGNSKGFAFINFASFETSDAAIESMNGQFLCNRAISISYAFKKESKGERHGTPAERLLAAQNPLSQADRPHQLFADAPPPPPSSLGLPAPPPPPPNVGLPSGDMMGMPPPIPPFPPPPMGGMPPHPGMMGMQPRMPSGPPPMPPPPGPPGPPPPGGPPLPRPLGAGPPLPRPPPPGGPPLPRPPPPSGNMPMPPMPPSSLSGNASSSSATMPPPSSMSLPSSNVSHSHVPSGNPNLHSSHLPPPTGGLGMPPGVPSGAPLPPVPPSSISSNPPSSSAPGALPTGSNMPPSSAMSSGPPGHSSVMPPPIPPQGSRPPAMSMPPMPPGARPPPPPNWQSQGSAVPQRPSGFGGVPPPMPRLPMPPGSQPRGQGPPNVPPNNIRPPPPPPF